MPTHDPADEARDAPPEQRAELEAERLHIALTASPAVVFEHDHELRYVWIHNPHPLFGAGGILGRTDFDLLPPEDAAPLTELKRGVLESGVPTRKVVQLTLDGRKHHYDMRVEPRRDAGGRVVGIVCASWDVSDHVAMEAALRESELRFRALADSMPQLVWTAGSDGAVDYYNARAREYAGLAPGADGVWSWQPVVHPDDLARTVATWEAAVARSADYACEHRVRMADGAFRWHVSRARLVRDPRGDRWFGTATDIHEQKLAEERLRLAVATRDRVVSVVAHDLRNPLSVVRTALPLLRGVLDARDAQARGEAYLARLERQVTRMEKLLDELLDAARVQAGQPLELDRRPCDLVALVRELVEEQASAGSAGPPVELRATTPTLLGAWDAPRLERVIGNLLSNAVKYSPARRAIVLEVARDGGDAVVRVVDHGVGIAPADRERIFEWFARGENAERTARGIGIGLAGARRIAEQHGGSLTVESELGVGSTFTLRLPL